MIVLEMKTWINSSSNTFWRIWLVILAIGVCLVVASVFLLDQRTAQHFGSAEMIRVWLFHRNITDLGEAGVYIVLAILALIIKKYRKMASYFLACMLSSGIVIHILKFLFGRARAHKFPDHNPFIFEPFSFHHHFQSFPSGHSQTVLTIACFVAFVYPKSLIWIMTLAFYLAFTRALTLAHFVSDVWAGAVIGILVSAITLRHLVQKYGT